MAVSVSVHGEAELLKLLMTLEPKVARKVIRPVQRKAAKVLQKEAQKNAPVGDTGQNKKNWKVRSGPRSRVEQSMMVINAASGLADQSQYAAVATEFGTSKQPPQGTARLSFDSKAGEGIKILETDTLAGIEKEAKSK